MASNPSDRARSFIDSFRGVDEDEDNDPDGGVTEKAEPGDEGWSVIHKADGRNEALESLADSYEHLSADEIESLVDNAEEAADGDGQVIAKARATAEATEAFRGALVEKEWVPYSGPQGGEGWRNVDTGDIVYDDEAPGDTMNFDELEAEDLEGMTNDEVINTAMAAAHQADDPGAFAEALGEAAGVDGINGRADELMVAEAIQDDPSIIADAMDGDVEAPDDGGDGGGSGRDPVHAMADEMGDDLDNAWEAATGAPSGDMPSDPGEAARDIINDDPQMALNYMEDAEPSASDAYMEYDAEAAEAGKTNEFMEALTENIEDEGIPTEGATAGDFDALAQMAGEDAVQDAAEEAGLTGGEEGDTGEPTASEFVSPGVHLEDDTAEYVDMQLSNIDGVPAEDAMQEFGKRVDEAIADDDTTMDPSEMGSIAEDVNRDLRNEGGDGGSSSTSGSRGIDFPDSATTTTVGETTINEAFTGPFEDMGMSSEEAEQAAANATHEADEDGWVSEEDLGRSIADAAGADPDDEDVRAMVNEMTGLSEQFNVEGDPMSGDFAPRDNVTGGDGGEDSDGSTTDPAAGQAAFEAIDSLGGPGDNTKDMAKDALTEIGERGEPLSEDNIREALSDLRISPPDTDKIVEAAMGDEDEKSETDEKADFDEPDSLTARARDFIESQRE